LRAADEFAEYVGFLTDGFFVADDVVFVVLHFD